MFNFLKRKDKNVIELIYEEEVVCVKELERFAYFRDGGYKEVIIKTDKQLNTLDDITELKNLESHIRTLGKGIKLFPDKYAIGVIDFGVGAVYLFENGVGNYLVYPSSTNHEISWRLCNNL